MGNSRGGATSAPSTDDIHLSVSFCLRRSISGIASHFMESRALIQNDSYSLFRLKHNNNRENRNLVTMKRFFNALKTLSCNRKLRYRWINSMKIKLQLKETFSEKISFFQSNNQWPDNVIVGDSIEEVLTTIAHPQTCIKSAAATLRAGILSHSSAIKDQHWPPTVEIVTAEHRSPPDTVKIFLNTLLYSGKKNIDKLDVLWNLCLR